ncbi:hypothetical protein QUA13_21920 [Microcoleus sp. S28C3]
MSPAGNAKIPIPKNANIAPKNFPKGQQFGHILGESGSERAVF